jgi:nucleoside-diphosphate-sugar epimerase
MSDIPDTRFLVTGGAGFIGSHLVDKLLLKGKVVVIDDLSQGSLDNLAYDPRIIFERRSILGDISKFFEGIDIVFHLAAKTRPQESIVDPVIYNKVNIDGTLNILRYCVDKKVKKLIFMSSSSLYGEQIRYPTSEEDEPNPLSPYALTKLIGENYCRLYQRLYNLQSCFIRPFNVFGSRQTPGGGYAAVVPKFIDTLKKNETPYITGDGEQKRDFVFVEDVVDLMIKVSESNISGEAFNAGMGENISINDLYSTICELMDKNIAPNHIDPVVEPRITLADMSKAKKIGWEAKYSLKEGLKTMI